MREDCVISNMRLVRIAIHESLHRKTPAAMTYTRQR